MLWTAPPTGRASALESVADEATRIRRSSPCRQSTTIGLDIAKSVFQVHGADARGSVVVRMRLTRSVEEVERRAIFATSDLHGQSLLDGARKVNSTGPETSRQRGNRYELVASPV
jgi:hypothetical protein